MTENTFHLCVVLQNFDREIVRLREREGEREGQRERERGGWERKEERALENIWRSTVVLNNK